jgi:hypothetical protein
MFPMKSENVTARCCTFGGVPCYPLPGGDGSAGNVGREFIMALVLVL